MDIARILVPTDLSANDRPALDAARTIAEKFAASIELVHVVARMDDEQAEWTGVGPGGEVVTPHQYSRHLAELNLERIAKPLREGGVQVRYHVEEGTPWRTIATIADRDLFDLVVIASGGRHWNARVFLGGMAEHVMRRAACPVLVVPTERSET